MFTTRWVRLKSGTRSATLCFWRSHNTATEEDAIDDLLTDEEHERMIGFEDLPGLRFTSIYYYRSCSACLRPLLVHVDVGLVDDTNKTCLPSMPDMSAFPNKSFKPFVINIFFSCILSFMLNLGMETSTLASCIKMALLSLAEVSCNSKTAIPLIVFGGLAG